MTISTASGEKPVYTPMKLRGIHDQLQQNCDVLRSRVRELSQSNLTDFKVVVELNQTSYYLMNCITAARSMKVVSAMALETGESLSMLPFSPEDCGIEL